MQFVITSSAQLSAHIKSLRKAKGWTQTVLGNRLGIGQARVAQIEKDPGAIGVATMLRILQLLDSRLLLEAQGNQTPGKLSKSGKTKASW